jgi:ABC-type glycerol-3-phosphate transport system substrate-binding protein
MLQVLALIIAALILAPLGAQAADLVVWWDKGFYQQEDEAVRDIITAFEQDSGKQVELVQAAQNEIVRRRRPRSMPGSHPIFCSPR